jgi:hypothetical protein
MPPKDYYQKLAVNFGVPKDLLDDVGALSTAAAKVMADQLQMQLESKVLAQVEEMMTGVVAKLHRRAFFLWGAGDFRRIMRETSDLYRELMTA